jgi:hypothetical protein
MIAMYLSTENQRERNRGAVLLMVLGIILLSSWIIVQVIARVGEEVKLRGVEDQNDALRATAFQTLEITMGVLAEIRALDGGLYAPAQGWGDPLAYAGFRSANMDEDATPEGQRDQSSMLLDDMVPFAFLPGIDVTISIIDASGKLPLNHTSPERWKLLFEEMEISSQDASLLTDTLLDWIDADDTTRLNGAESGFYQRNDPPYHAANRPIEDLQELRLIEGFDRLFFDVDGVPNSLFRLFSECVTPLDVADINYNSVHPLVLAVLAEELEFEASEVSEFINGADLEAGTDDDRVLYPDLEQADVPTDNEGKPLKINASCRFLTIYIDCQSAGTSFELAVRVDTETPSEKGIYPMTILDLRTKGSTL